MTLSFIKLDINIMNDTKIKIIRSMPDGDKILILWIGILCLGMQSGKAGVLEIGDGIPFTEETLSAELNIPVNTVKLGLQTFKQLKMIELLNDQALYISNFEKHQELDKIELGREKVRLRVAKSREKKKLQLENKCNNDVTVTSVTCNDTDIEQDKEIDKEIDKDKKPNKNKKTKFIPPTKEQINEYVKENNYKIDTDYFYKYFTASDWVDANGKKVQNWKQKIITWDKFNKDKPNKTEYNAHQQKTGENISDFKDRWNKAVQQGDK